MQTTQKWEYLTLESTLNYGTTKYIVNGDQQPAIKNQPLYIVVNQLGSQGWELVGMSAVGDARQYVFKRPTDKTFVPPAPKKPA
ncbi:MAG: hypothetical protein SF029_19455 [bacterium]|jgi:hypothetical protein|nr:hypothetical protein [bacterium]